MKILVVFAAACLALAKSDNVVENAGVAPEKLVPEPRLPGAADIQAKIEKLRDDYVKKGFSNIGLEDSELPINSEALGISANIKATGNITGALNFKVASLTGFLFTYKYQLQWPKIEVNIEPYDLQGFVHMIQVFGNGNLRIKIENLDLSGSFVVKIVDGDKDAIQIRKFDLNVKMEPINFQLTGWLNDETRSEIISDLVEENLQGLLIGYKEDINNLILSLVKDIKISIKE